MGQSLLGVFCFSGMLIILGVLGRRDFTRPHILFPMIWFAACVLAQFHLLDYQRPWHSTMWLLSALVPAAFSLGSVLTSGSTSSRRDQLRDQDPTDLRAARNLLLAAILLLLVGAVGFAFKVQILGGIPLLAESIDELRSAGGIEVRAYVTMATDGFFLSFWCSFLAIYIRHRHAVLTGSTIRLKPGELLLLSVALIGVALSASRNTLLITLAVPLIFLYGRGYLRAATTKSRVTVFLVSALLLGVLSGLFFLRTAQHKEGKFEATFYSYTVPRTSPAIRPLLPLFVGVVTPLETLNRVSQIDPGAIDQVHRGIFSVPGIPPQVSPFGKRADFYAVTGRLSRPYYFNVSTFAGPLFLDGNVFLVAAGSVFFGAVSGRIWARTQRGGLGWGVCGAITTYTTAFLLYENLLTFFTLSFVWDILVMTCVVVWATWNRRDDSKGLLIHVARKGSLH